jgi:hypothetical protein
VLSKILGHAKVSMTEKAAQVVDSTSDSLHERRGSSEAEQLIRNPSEGLGNSHTCRAPLAFTLT